MCLTLQPHGQQHARISCSLPFPGVCSNSRPLSWWCYSNYLILCHALLLLPSVFPSIRVFSNELSIHIRWPKCWSFSISLCNEYSGLISFSINWFDLLAVQRILRSLLVSKFQNLIYWRKILQPMPQAILFPFFLSEKYFRCIRNQLTYKLLCQILKRLLPPLYTAPLRSKRLRTCCIWWSHLEQHRLGFLCSWVPRTVSELLSESNLSWPHGKDNFPSFILTSSLPSPSTMSTVLIPVYASWQRHFLVMKGTR